MLTKRYKNPSRDFIESEVFTVKRPRGGDDAVELGVTF